MKHIINLLRARRDEYNRKADALEGLARAMRVMGEVFQQDEYYGRSEAAYLRQREPFVALAEKLDQTAFDIDDSDPSLSDYLFYIAKAATMLGGNDTKITTADWLIQNGVDEATAYESADLYWDEMDREDAHGPR